MLELFKPETKVQRDRKIMRETDARMAKYSRRGIMFTFFVFVIALLVGSFYDEYTELALMLACGLLLLTLLRSYLLFRFDVLYARGPSRWRNVYFFASFCGAILWSVILCSMTLTVGLKHEVSFMWFYTAVFFATITNVMAPYRRFMTLYMYMGIAPSAIAALVLGTIDGYLYGFTFIILLFLLRNQIRLVCSSYWNRLEANYQLKQRANVLEVEKRDSLAAVQFNNSFLSNLSNDFRSSLNDIMGALSLLEGSELSARQREWVQFAEKAGERQLNLVNNVKDFSQLNSDSLVLDINVFNLRRHLESLLEDLCIEANRQGFELNYIFDNTLPVRVRGDAIRIAQILSNLAHIMINRSQGGNLLFKAEQQIDENDKGVALFTIKNVGGHVDLSDDELVNNPYLQAHKNHPGIGLGLSISKGLTESMGGFLQFRRTEKGDAYFSFQLEMEATGMFVADESSFPPKRIVLSGFPEEIQGNIADACLHWGLMSEVVKDEKTLLERIDEPTQHQHPVEAVFLYAEKDISELPNALNTLFTMVPNVAVLCALSPIHMESAVYRDNKAVFERVNIVFKPIIRQHLKDALRLVLALDADNAAESVSESKPHILIVDDQRVDQQVVDAMIRKMGCQTTVASSGEEALTLLPQQQFDLTLLDCNMPGLNGYDTAAAIRQKESEAGTGQHMPIIAISADASEGEHGICLAAGMDDYLPKPTRYNELQKRVQRWLKQRPRVSQ